MDMTELWEKACMLLKGEMNEISYNTWIQSSLKPLSLEGDCLTLCTSAEYMKSMIASRYATLIANALGEVAGHPMQVEILTRAEVDKKQSQAEPETPPVRCRWPRYADRRRYGRDLPHLPAAGHVPDPQVG